jgi:hypothetical protein
MRRLLLIAVLASVAFAQSVVHQVSIKVVDIEGKPIANARIDHTGTLVFIGPPDQPIERGTDSDGHFALTTDRPAVVIRKPGFTSYRLRIDRDMEARVMLQPAPPHGKCEVAKIPGVQYQEMHDIDYSGIVISVPTAKGRKAVISGHGANYSNGAPSNSDVWDSVEYSEVMAVSGVVDARGKLPDGKYWRTRSELGASAWYAAVDRPTALLLDRLIDGDCH